MLLFFFYLLECNFDHFCQWLRWKCLFFRSFFFNNKRYRSRMSAFCHHRQFLTHERVIKTIKSKKAIKSFVLNVKCLNNISFFQLSIQLLWVKCCINAFLNCCFWNFRNRFLKEQQMAQHSIFFVWVYLHRPCIALNV